MHLFAASEASRLLVKPLTLFPRQQVDLVPGLDPRRCTLFRQAQRREHVVDILALSLTVGVREVADMDEQVGLPNFFERSAESCDQLGRQIRNETNSVG